MTIRKEHGIIDLLEQRKEDLLTKTKALNPKTAYDAERNIMQVIAELNRDEDLVEKLRQGVFQVGADIDVYRRCAICGCH